MKTLTYDKSKTQAPHIMNIDGCQISGQEKIAANFNNTFAAMQKHKLKIIKILDICLTTKTKQLVKQNASYLVGTAISLNLSYLLPVRLAASTVIPFNTHKVKKKRKQKKKHCKLSQALCSITL